MGGVEVSGGGGVSRAVVMVVLLMLGEVSVVLVNSFAPAIILLVLKRGRGRDPGDGRGEAG